MLRFVALSILVLGISGPTFPDPVNPPAPVPAPVVAPVIAPATTVQELTPDLYYIIESKTECLVISSPADAVTIEAATGPIRLRGRFIDNPTKVQTKTFAGPYVYSVDAAKSKMAELIVLPSVTAPALVQKPTDVQRRTIKVSVPEQPVVDPINPDPVTPLTSLSKKAVTWYANVKSPDKRKEATLLISNFKKMAALLNTPTAFTTQEDFSNAIRAANQASISDANEPAWREAFGVPLMAELKQRVATLADNYKVAAELATGLEAALRVMEAK